MNKQENQTYAKLENKKNIDFSNYKKYAKVFISTQNYLHFVNNKRLLAVYLQRKLLLKGELKSIS